MKRALITGGAGFVGSHLAEHLIKKDIHTSVIFHPNHSTINLQQIAPKITMVGFDLLSGGFKNIDFKSYDYLFHLAAFSSPNQSFSNPKQTLENNIFSQLNLLEEIARQKSKIRILIVGSADEYGPVESKYLPVDEEVPLAPNSPYAVSKVAQDMLGYQFFLNYGLNIVRVRPFNHIGPRQSEAFVVPAFASQLARLELKGKGTVRVGNLETWRDFTDVRDITKAYLLALEKGKKGDVYNLGSGKAVKIADILKKLIHISKAEIQIEQDKSLYRGSEAFKIYCDFSKFNKATNWKPEIELDKTLFDTIEYERNKLK